MMIVQCVLLILDKPAYLILLGKQASIHIDIIRRGFAYGKFMHTNVHKVLIPLARDER